MTVLPDEARHDADVIFAGEAEGLWEEFLRGQEVGAWRQAHERGSAPSS